jgi:hypothetical protein
VVFLQKKFCARPLQGKGTGQVHAGCKKTSKNNAEQVGAVLNWVKT